MDQPTPEQELNPSTAAPAEDSGIEDIFGDTDAGDALPIAPIPGGAPVEAVVSDDEAPNTRRRRRIGRGSLIRVVALVVVVLILAGIAALAFFWSDIQNAVTSTDATLSDEANVTTPVQAEPVGGAEQPQPGSGLSDLDGDGLNDVEEKDLGTDPNLADTDGDGLSDRQEVDVYNTDPTDRDSDSDGFDDGDEVRNFFDPNGSGKLLEVTEAIEEFNNANSNEAQ